MSARTTHLLYTPSTGAVQSHYRILNLTLSHLYLFGPGVGATAGGTLHSALCSPPTNTVPTFRKYRGCCTPRRRRAGIDGTLACSQCMLSENEKQRETADEKAALNRASRAVDTTRQSTTARGGRGQPRSMSAPPSAPYGTGPHGSPSLSDNAAKCKEQRRQWREANRDRIRLCARRSYYRRALREGQGDATSIQTVISSLDNQIAAMLATESQ